MLRAREQSRRLAIDRAVRCEPTGADDKVAHTGVAFGELHVGAAVAHGLLSVALKLFVRHCDSERVAELGSGMRALAGAGECDRLQLHDFVLLVAAVLAAELAEPLLGASAETHWMDLRPRRALEEWNGGTGLKFSAPRISNATL